MLIGCYGHNPATLIAKMKFTSNLLGGHVGLCCCAHPRSWSRTQGIAELRPEFCGGSDRRTLLISFLASAVGPQ